MKQEYWMLKSENMLLLPVAIKINGSSVLSPTTQDVLFEYLKEIDIERYRAIIKTLNLRK